ncbi:MAG: hypothetical protein KY475_24015, partial [Planctomycetes bacterium]|nr:hypothetical protein [Planctomycetota bacterium]
MLEQRRLLAVDLPTVLDIDTNRNTILDVAEIQALIGTLDNGTYIFRRLATGEYHVSLPGDLSEPLAANETLMTLDFRGSVSGVKWSDLNANGLREAGEPGMEGVRIFADVNSDGAFNDGEPFATTRADGSYSLVLPPGVVSIREVAAAGTVQTFPFGAQQGAAAQGALFAAGELSTGRVVGASRHNDDMPADVNLDGDVTVADALFIVQEWRVSGPRLLGGESEPDPENETQGAMVDVNADGYLSVADLWGVVDVLRGEGEARAFDDEPGQTTPDPFTVQANTSQNVLPVLANDQGDGRLTITGVGTLAGGIVGNSAQGDQGGQITVQTGSGQNDDVVLYTPRPDFFGVERFIYEVRDEASAMVDRGEVQVRVVP